MWIIDLLKKLIQHRSRASQPPPDDKRVRFGHDVHFRRQYKLRRIRRRRNLLQLRVAYMTTYGLVHPISRRKTKKNRDAFRKALAIYYDKF